MKKLLAFILLTGIVLAQDLPDNCQQEGSYWFCPRDVYISSVTGTFTDDVECFANSAASCSTDCASVVDVGCFSTVKVGAMTINQCYDRVNETDYELGVRCLNISTPETEYDAFIDPKLINFASCSQTSENDVLDIVCPYVGKSMTFNAVLSNGDLAIAETAAPTGFDLGAMLYGNAMYIVLAIILLAVLYWAFAPRKEGKKK